MKKYFVSVPVFASAGIEVSAKNKAEAIEKAVDEIYPTLCHQCSEEVDLGDPDWDNAEAEEIK